METFERGGNLMFGVEEEKAVLRVIRSGILSGYQGNWSENFYGGPEVKALEKEWSEYFGVKHSIFCNSATSGLWAALNAIGLKPYVWNSKAKNYQPEIQEILVTPYSMTCSASIPLVFGANAVFVDIEEDYFCMDPDKIEEKITQYTKAIIVVNLFGQPADYDRINSIAKNHNLYVIEDNAQGTGAKYKGKYAGTLADIGIFSLNRHKHINCGEGGIITTNNDELAMRLRLSCNHAEAIVNSEFHSDEPFPVKVNFDNMVGMNLRGTELSAAIAREQLKKLDSILAVYQENAKYFPVKVRPECTSAFYKYAYTEVVKKKMPDKFNFKRHYIDPIYKMPLFQTMGYEPGLCPVCEKVEENIVLAWMKEVV
jgi:dTDP-4-amino-4,6-dideoxygalactose transaminase